MNGNEFNECSNYLNELENIIVTSNKLSVDNLMKNKLRIVEKCNNLSNEYFMEQYLCLYNNYLSNLICKYDLRFD